MTTQTFYSLYGTESQCIADLKTVREKSGIICKSCGSGKHYWLEKPKQWQCASCRFRTGLKSGTLFQHSHLPLHMWYQAIYFMSETKKSISTLELQRKLGLKRLATAWFLQLRIRMMMGGADHLTVALAGEIEMDDAFITTVFPKDQDLKDEPLSRGRGSQRKHAVVVMVESETKDDGSKGRCGNLKIATAEHISSPEINDLANTMLKRVQKVRTDGHPAYRQLGNTKKHTWQAVKPKDAPKVLPWVHIAISNIKRLLNGIYHSVSERYLQYYLDEFVFKFNKRFNSNKFEILTHYVLSPKW